METFQQRCIKALSFLLEEEALSNYKFQEFSDRMNTACIQLPEFTASDQQI